MEDITQVYLEIYKGKHGQSDTEYQAGRSDAGKRISGDEKSGPRNYTLGRARGAAVDPPTAPGAKPVNTPKLSSSEKEYHQYNKSGAKRRSEYSKVGGSKGLPGSVNAGYEPEDEMVEAWYSGQSGYRTTASGRRVMRDEPDEAEQLRQSDAIAKNPKVQAERQAAAKARLAAKGNLPIRKPKQNEEFELYVENLQNEGYDLSNWTWEGIEEFYIDEAKKMKGEDPCWKGYQMVGTKKKGGKEVPNCVPKEEKDYVDEEKKEFPSARVKAQAAKHMRNYLTRPNSAVGQRSKQKSKKMDAIRSTVEVGDDPRSTMHGQDLRKIGEEFDAIVEYLFVEGYAKTIEHAEIMAESIGDDWANEILDEKHVKAMDTTGRGADHRTRFPKFKGKDDEFDPEFLRKRVNRNDKKIDPYFSGRKERKDERRQGVGGFSEAKADPEDAVQRLRARNMRLQQDHPEVPSGRPQTEFRRKRHEESRGKKGG